MRDKYIVAFPHPPAFGGPGSFQYRAEKFIKSIGWKVVYASDRTQPDAIFVVGGTKRIRWLWKMKKKNVPIIHRLDGINWLHKKVKVSLETWIIDEGRNRLIQLIKYLFADLIVYQSKYVEKIWLEYDMYSKKKYEIIPNGIDLSVFQPITRDAKISLLCVEGHLDYSPFAIELINKLQEALIEKSEFESIICYGKFNDQKNRQKLHPSIIFKGLVPREQIPLIFKNAIYLSLDINAACPNTVIEALGCGIPVIGFNTGALSELVKNDSGIIVDYGSDPHQLAFPKLESLVEAAHKINSNWQYYSNNARQLAQEKFDIEKIMEQYLELITHQIKKSKSLVQN